MIFACTMDEIIYHDMRKTVIMPLQMARIRGEGNLALATTTLTSSANFAKNMMPHGGIHGNAKELLLKDADYSTPSDHYFSHLQRLKSGGFSQEEQENKVLDEMKVDHSALQIMLDEHNSKEKSLTEMFAELPHEYKMELAGKRGWNETDFERMTDLLAESESDLHVRRTKKDNKILDNTSLGKILDVKVPDAKP